MKILTAPQMREVDKITIEKVGIPGIVLMENAALKIVDFLKDKFSPLKGKKVGIFVGKGNNGGDGLAVVRHLKNLGAEPRVYLLAEKNKIAGDAKINLDVAFNLGIDIVEILSQGDLDKFKTKICHEAIHIDAILGTGTTKPVSGLFSEVISFLNSLSIFMLAIDIPSGMYTDTGELAGNHIHADATVALSNPKICNLQYPAAKYCGKVVVADIGIPQFVTDSFSPASFLLTPDIVKKWVRQREDDSHKGTYGHLLAICGSKGKGGAAGLASLAALRSGTGLVTLGIPESINAFFEVGIPEVMTLPLPETKEGSLSKNGYKIIVEKWKDKNALLIGPGLTTDKEVSFLTKQLVAKALVPVILDADGLNIFADDEIALIAKREFPTVLTPHPGEMARMWATTSAKVQADRINFAKKTAITCKACVVLKGANTVIATQSGEIFINTTGNSGMATGGTGDVLAGMIAGFVAQGMNFENAACLGVYLHGKAGDIAAKTQSKESIIASDLIFSLSEAFKAINS